MKILCLFVRHGTAKYPTALDQLDAWYERHGLRDRRMLWILDNSLPTSTPPRVIGPSIELRAGDNRGWEFSAWDKSLKEARDLPGIDVVHFVTSAFHTLYTGYLEHFRPNMLDFVARNRVCLGHIDAYPTPVTIREQDSTAWIRTCFFFLARDVALAHRPWVAFPNETEIFDGTQGHAFREDAPVCTEYQRRITHWLKGGEQGGHQWHSAVTSGEEEAQRFRKKSLAILNEHSLSIQWRRDGVVLTDFCWHWATAPAAGDEGEMPPDEAAQLRVRRRVLNIPE